MKQKSAEQEVFNFDPRSALCRQKSFLRQNDVLTENGDQRTDQPTGWPRNFRKFQVLMSFTLGGSCIVLGRAT